MSTHRQHRTHPLTSPYFTSKQLLPDASSVDEDVSADISVALRITEMVLPAKAASNPALGLQLFAAWLVVGTVFLSAMLWAFWGSHSAAGLSRQSTFFSVHNKKINVPLAPMAQAYELLQIGYEQQVLLKNPYKALAFYEAAAQKLQKQSTLQAKTPEKTTWLWLNEQRALCYQSLGDLPRAGYYAQQMIALNPQSPHGYVALGNVALEAREYAQAIEHYQQALPLLKHQQHKPYSAHNLTSTIENRLGYAFEQLGDLLSSRRHYALALASAPPLSSNRQYAQDALSRL